MIVRSTSAVASSRAKASASSCSQASSLFSVPTSGHAAFSRSFWSNDFCDRAFGFSRLCETRSPESPHAENMLTNYYPLTGTRPRDRFGRSIIAPRLSPTR